VYCVMCGNPAEPGQVCQSCGAVQPLTPAVGSDATWGQPSAAPSVPPPPAGPASFGPPPSGPSAPGPPSSLPGGPTAPTYGPQSHGPPPSAPAPSPSYGAPSYGAPSYGAPSYGAPSYGAPSYGPPSYGGANYQQAGRYRPPGGPSPAPFYAPYQPTVPAFPPARRINGLAIASLICSMSGLFCGVTALLGVIFGFVARSQIRRSMGNQSGAGLALAGIIVGLVILALIVAWVAFLTAVNVGNSK
jgi:hypothetical protein